MKRSCLIIALLFAIVSIGSADMLTNGGFESLGWTYFGNSGRTDWSVRNGSWGSALWGWDPAASGGIWQDVTCPGTGVYTFTAFFFQEQNFNPSTFEVKLEGYASGLQSESPTITTHVGLPKDGFWHEVFVTATITNPATTAIRPVIAVAWNGSNYTKEAVMFDDTKLYSGPHTGSVVELSNPDFEKGIWEVGVGYTNGSWRGSQWAEVPENLQSQRSWGNRSGTNGVALFGWDAQVNTSIQISQPIYSGTGTYTFSVWMSREGAFNMSNAQLRIEWYDATCSNKVQADSVTNFLVPSDNYWRQYYVTGTCTSNNLYEIRPVINALWNGPTNAGGQAARIDDARWIRGTYDGYSVNTDWAYHSAIGARASVEQVPGTNVGTFLQVNYNTHSNTFRILTLNPTIAKFTNLGDGMEVGLRTAWQKPEDNNWVETLNPMTKLGTVQIPSGSAFRGQPASGTATVDLWEVSMIQPTNISGAFYTTNSIRVYYTPYLKSTNGIVTTDIKYLLLKAGDLTNALGQTIGPVYFDNDYFFDVYKPPTWAVFTNGGFENPTPVASTLDGTGWTGYGDAGRETWAARSGGAGALFRTWNPGSFGLYQDIATTGGTYQFTGWVKCQTNATPSLLKMKMEWYDKSGSLVQENAQDLLAGGLHQEDEWSRIGVVGNCSVTNLDYVRLLLVGEFGPKKGEAGEQTSTEFDDMEFGVVATNLQNVGFETGSTRDIRDWYGVPQWLVMNEPWANHTGIKGAAFHGWETNYPQFEAKLYQPVVASTGTYVYSAWIKREQWFSATNTEIKLEWYSGSYTGKVQADTVVKITPPNDGIWYEYSITGTCNNTSLRFVQPVIFSQWGFNGPVDPRSFMIDDTALVYTNLSGGGETYTDGIPDSWLTLYGLGHTNGVATGDDDSDGYLNIEEYAGNTIPTSNLSFFSNVTNVPGSKTVMYLIVNPSSGARVYDAFWKTNLMEYSVEWQSYGLSVPGNGGLITLTVTNDLGKRFFRTGARLP